MTDPPAASGTPDLTAAWQAPAAIREMLAADGYAMSLRALGTDALAVAILAGLEACAECVVPKNIMSGIIRNAFGPAAPVARIQLSYPAQFSP